MEDATGLRVLLVEDSGFDARLVLEQLRVAAPGTYSTVHVERLADARDELSLERTDCVLLDLALPDASGLHGLRTLLALHPEVPVVVLSASDESVLGAEAVKAGAQDYLTKGEIDGRQLWRSIRYAMERKRAQLPLRHQAMHDSLTGLPNRVLFLDRLSQALARLARRPGQLSVLFLDLDGFKRVNDSFGHEAGDTVMVEVARRLQSALRPYDTAARIGGDEFLVLAEAQEGDDEATVHLATRIQEHLAGPIRVQSTDITVSASIGMICTNDSSADAASLIRDADVAMYRAKALGKNRWTLFDACMRDQTDGSVVPMREQPNKAPRVDELALVRGLAPRLGATDELLDASALDLLVDRIGRGPVMQLVAMFRDDVTRSGPRLSAAAAAGDHVEVAALAHRLRSAARTLGADRLTDMLGALEEKAARVPNLTAVVDAVVGEMGLVAADLAVVTAEDADAL